MKLFVGNLAHSTKEEPLQILPQHILLVNDVGKIEFVGPLQQLDEVKSSFNVPEINVIQLGTWEFLMPGFIDTHVHPAQYVLSGLRLDLPLLQWLDKYVIPSSERFDDPEFAEEAFTKAVKCLLRNGTTTACYNASYQVEATKRLTNVVDILGQRALIGRHNADYDPAANKREDTNQAINSTTEIIEYIQKKKNPRVYPILYLTDATRCTAELMSRLADIAVKMDLPITSHMSETKSQCDELMKKIFSDYKSYASVYESCGLLTNKTVMAHCVYMNDDEIELFKKAGTGIAHCPNSNISLVSGLLDVRKMLLKGLAVGLGTDVSGGYSPSILNSMRFALLTSKVLEIQNGGNYKALDHTEVFHLATLGGAKVLGMEHQIGNFEVGKEFDALRINPVCKNSPFDLFDTDDLSDMVQRFIYLGDDRNIEEVYVQGAQVKPA